jgi:type I restriction-modification system DNA methylase subunit
VNERKTEDIVEARLRMRGYYEVGSGIVVEKQKSDSARIQHLLENASKKGTGVGRPEFIIHSTSISDFLIVIECKANVQKHVSKTLDQYADYAVDGALLYSSFLSKEFDVLAIAVSGQTEAELRVSHYLHLKGASKAVEYTEAKDIISFNDYYNGFLKSGVKFKQDYAALLDYSRILNNELQVKKIKESQRGFLISGILIALQNKAFKDSFKLQRTAKQLAKNLVETIGSEFENAELPEDRRDSLTTAFSFIKTHPSLRDKDFFVGLIEGIENNVNVFMRTHKYYDTIGQFYVEFLRYANNDKGLGIVLTPPHVAELFAGLAGVNEHSIVFDNCCGTAGLLIAAMKEMILDAKSDQGVQTRIKNQQLFGIEYQVDIYALAVSNMVLHGDGKTNIYRGDCFEDSKEFLSQTKPNVGLLNPPYKNKANIKDREELEFVLNNLDVLEPDGKCVAIVPITCATAPSGKMYELKRAILERHTLEAVMSMPIELFHNSKTNVVTCVMVLTAHRPHPKGKKTWFGYWRDDGFVKTKHRGRIDLNGMWDDVKNKWLNAFRNREVADGNSVMCEVQAHHEWCAEAYMETDYVAITENQLSTSAKKYFLNNIMTMHDIRVEADN